MARRTRRNIARPVGRCLALLFGSLLAAVAIYRFMTGDTGVGIAAGGLALFSFHFAASPGFGGRSAVQVIETWIKGRANP
jgi:hypothetical protein